MPVGRDVRLATFGIACLSFPVLYDLNLGNMSVVLFAASAGLWRWQARPVAGPLLAGSIAIRPPFVVVAVGWLARGAIRPVAWTIVAGLVMVALTLPIVGVSGWLDYVTILRGLGPIGTGPHNVNLSSTVLALGLGDQAGRLVVIGGYVATVVAIVYAARRRDADVALVVSIVATLVLTPFIHSHYLVLLLLPTALLVDRGWWWALLLPLLGWLPEEYLPAVALVAMLLPLAPWLPGALDQVRAKTSPSAPS
jgi:hypothetical protein